MAEVTYLSQVECVVLNPDWIANTQIVSVFDEEGGEHTILAPKGGLVEKGDKKYLPVGLVYIDYKGKRGLVELPEEADSGTSRVWVPFARFRRKEDGE